MLTSQVLVIGGAGTLGSQADLPTCGGTGSTASVLRGRAQRQILRTQEVGGRRPSLEWHSSVWCRLSRLCPLERGKE